MEDNSRFEGEIDKIVLESEESVFCHPEPGQEIRQRITIHKYDRLSFTRYYVNDYSKYPMKAETKMMKRYSNKYTDKLIYYIAEYFRENHDEVILCDAGTWRIELSNTDGKKWRFSGSLGDKLEVFGFDLSALARKTLVLPELWMFDGEEGNLVIHPMTIDEYTDQLGHPPMTVFGETEHFRYYEDKDKRNNEDVGVPIFVVENIKRNVFTLCSADASYPIMDYFGGGCIDEAELENMVAYDIMKCQILSEYDSMANEEDLLAGIERNNPDYCSSCIHSHGDKYINDGPDKVQCQMYYNPYDFKPFEVMFNGESCDFYEEENHRNDNS